MSKDMRKMIDKAKSFGQLLSEQSLHGGKMWYHGTDEMFESPNFMNTGREMGFHLGSYEQALNIKQMISNSYPKYINKYKVEGISPLRVRDLESWPLEHVADELARNGLEVEKSGKGFLGSKYYKEDDILGALKRSGFDSLVYKNEHEGEGDSIIVFYDNQITFMGREEIKAKEDDE